ncbi:TVP38/TMEM64 family protein [Marinobacter caseinilyticus]|uniref:TVP38/TMEM64 family protein n=1 Tax=Marinobacter caseinilyticus TaxID=2692195 RepID=UPI0014092B94|nr:TVP38/TMEM64 family protein [Marinobacter caseinilyticus]
MATNEQEQRFDWKHSPTLALLGSVLVVGVILAILYSLGMHQQVVSLLQWFDDQGAWAAVLFVLVMAAVMLLLLPGVLFTTGAGFVFGVLEGTAYVVAGTVLGASLAFLTARHALGDRARTYLLSHARLRLMNEELAPHGWKVVLLTRLIPFFPSKVSNFVFGLTRVSFGGFFMGCLIGYIPFSLHNVYLGSIAADITTMGVRHTARTPLEWTIYGLGFVATVVAIFYLNRLAKRALAKYTRHKTLSEDPP